MLIHEETVFAHLDREWDHLIRGHRLRDVVARWREVETGLATFDDVHDLLTFLADRKADPGHQSEVLLALLRLAPKDDVAARLVLQRFLPSFKTVAGWEQPWPQVDWAAMVVSTAHEVIVTYPIERRPRRVAANIVWDVRKRMYAVLTDHRHRMIELPLSDPRPREDARPDTDVAERFENADLLRWAAQECDLPRDVARLMVLTRVGGYEVKEIAERCDVPSARLRQRRWRCERRMREVLTAAS